jgi:hypothetical protein
MPVSIFEKLSCVTRVQAPSRHRAATIIAPCQRRA